MSLQRHFSALEMSLIAFLAIYAKTRRENLPAHVIRWIKDKM
jgi:hypothetical protein